MIDRDTHRALVEAGLAPLSEYIAIYSGGCAPPVLVPRLPTDPLQCNLDASEGGGDTVTPAFAPVVPCLHAEPIATSKRDNPHGR